MIAAHILAACSEEGTAHGCSVVLVWSSCGTLGSPSQSWMQRSPAGPPRACSVSPGCKAGLLAGPRVVRSIQLQGRPFSSLSGLSSCKAGLSRACPVCPAARKAFLGLVWSVQLQGRPVQGLSGLSSFKAGLSGACLVCPASRQACPRLVWSVQLQGRPFQGLSGLSSCKAGVSRVCPVCPATRQAFPELVRSIQLQRRPLQGLSSARHAFCKARFLARAGLCRSAQLMHDAIKGRCVLSLFGLAVAHGLTGLPGGWGLLSPSSLLQFAGHCSYSVACRLPLSHLCCSSQVDTGAACTRASHATASNLAGLLCGASWDWRTACCCCSVCPGCCAPLARSATRWSIRLPPFCGAFHFACTATDTTHRPLGGTTYSSPPASQLRLPCTFHHRSCCSLYPANPPLIHPCPPLILARPHVNTFHAAQLGQCSTGRCCCGSAGTAWSLPGQALSARCTAAGRISSLQQLHI